MILYAIPFISAAIGWITNYVAIKMLFHPREVMNLYLFKLHGIFPKRQHILAQRLGKVVERDLFSMDIIKKKVDNENTKSQIKDAISKELESYLINLRENNKMIAMFLNDKALEQIKGKLEEQLDEMIPRLISQATDKLEEIDIEQIVTEKVKAFSSEKLEGLLMSVIEKELQFIEMVGAVLGFLIGALQVGILKLSGEI